jgi:hypothetical protein
MVLNAINDKTPQIIGDQPVNNTKDHCNKTHIGLAAAASARARCFLLLTKDAPGPVQE